MKVVLAEKPSVGKAIAAVLGAKSSKDGYMEGNGYIVTWAFGHLVGLAEPDHYLGHKEWKKEDLPIIPEEFVYVPQVDDSGARKQYNTIKKLFCAKETDCVICATDAGREGEAIFRYIYDSFDCRKPVKRLWVSSLTDKAIRDGFNDLKPGEDYDDLYDSAKARGEADWLVGDNATRALTLAVGNAGQVYSVGRVQTPTLGMVCKRYLENKNFVPVPYFMVRVKLQSSGKTEFFGLYPQQHKEKADAEAFMGKIPGLLVVKEKRKQEVKEKAPLPYDITSIQADANRRHKFKAQKTLDIVQALYEGKKVTYPRTGSRYLGEDMIDVVASSVGKLSSLGYTPNFAECCRGITPSGMNRACFDSSKLTDHHAIIPTFENVSDDVKDFPSGKTFSSEDSRKIYRMITMQLVMSLLPVCVKDRVTYLFEEVDSVALAVTGSTIKSIGWRKLCEQDNEKDEEAEEEQKLPDMDEGAICSVLGKEVLQKETKRPPLLTEATLLKMMESAGKLIEDDAELSKAIKDCGIGTPATRAAVIEKLFTRKYIVTEKNSLVPTEGGLQLYELLKDHSICNVSMTGEWEKKLNEMAEGKFAKADFNHEIEEYTRNLTTELLTVKSGSIASSVTSVGNCPVCGKPLKTHGSVVYCSGWRKDDEKSCQFKIFTEVRGKKLTEKMVKTLLNGGTTDIIKGFKKKDGTPFDAALTLDENHKLTFSLPKKKELELACPFCGKKLLESDKSYYCSGYGQEDGSCKFGVSKERGGVKITLQMLKEILSLEATGKSYEFKSKEGKRFTAKLKYNKDEMKLEYLFEERKREATGLKCPHCGGDIVETDKSFECVNHDFKKEGSCQFSLWKTVAGRKVSVKELETLLSGGATRTLEGFKSSSGKAFSAKLKLVDGKISFLFDKKQG